MVLVLQSLLCGTYGKSVQPDMRRGSDIDTASISGFYFQSETDLQRNYAGCGKRMNIDGYFDVT